MEKYPMAMQSRTVPLPEPRSASPRVLSALLVILGGVSIGGLAFVDPRYAAFAALAIGLLMLFVVRADLAVMTVLLGRALIEYIPRGVRLPIPGLPSGGGLEALIAGFLMVATVVYLLAHRGPFFRAPLTIPFIIFQVTMLATIVTSQNRFITILYWARILSYFLIYIFVYDLVRRSPAHRDRWWRFTIFLAAFIPAMAWAATVVEGGAWRVVRSGVIRLQGPFGALEFGTLLMIPMILFTVQFIEARGTAKRWWALGLAFIALSFALSGSRGPWAGFVAAALVLGILRYHKLPFAVCGVGLLGMLLVPGIGRRITEVFVSPEQTTLQNRLNVWSEAFDTFKAHPILGIGFGVGYLFAALSKSQLIHPTHSDYVRVLADAGIVGFVAFLIFLAAQGLHGLRVFRGVRDPLHQRIALIFIGSFVAYMVARTSGNVLTHAEFNFQFWSLAGLVSALPALERGETREGGG